MDELDAGHPRPDHHEVLGQLLGRIGVAGGEHAVPVEIRPGRDAGRRPVLSSMASASKVLAPSAVTATTVWGRPGGRCRVPRAPLAAEDPLVVCSRRPTMPVIRSRSPLEVDLAPTSPPPCRRPPRGRTSPPRWRSSPWRGRSPKVGGSADEIPLDEGHVDAEPGGIGGGLVARRPTTDDHEPHPARLEPIAPGPEGAGSTGPQWCSGVAQPAPGMRRDRHHFGRRRRYHPRRASRTPGVLVPVADHSSPRLDSRGTEQNRHVDHEPSSEGQGAAATGRPAPAQARCDPGTADRGDHRGGGGGAGIGARHLGPASRRHHVPNRLLPGLRPDLRGPSSDGLPRRRPRRHRSRGSGHDADGSHHRRGRLDPAGGTRRHEPAAERGVPGGGLAD